MIQITAYPTLVIRACQQLIPHRIGDRDTVTILTLIYGTVNPSVIAFYITAISPFRIIIYTKRRIAEGNILTDTAKNITNAKAFTLTVIIIYYSTITESL